MAFFLAVCGYADHDALSLAWQGRGCALTGGMPKSPHWYDLFGGGSCPPTVWYNAAMTQTELVEPAELVQRVVDELSERQIKDIVQIDVRRVSGFADYFVIGTATNERQMKAAVDALDRDLGLQGIHLRAREGTPDSGWMLLDFRDVIVHLFSPEARAYYRLEDLWGRNAPVVRFA